MSHSGAPPPEPTRHAHGRDFWRRVLAEAESAAGGVAPLAPGLSRRGFLGALAASAALAGLGGCFEAPSEEILPYSRRPEDVLPGVPTHYATTFELGGYGTGLVVESHEGRPIKVEGNPAHPASLGGAGVFEQASILELYDPDRLREVRHRGRPVTRDALRESLRGAATADPDLAGTHVLLEPTASPLVLALLDRLRERRRGVRVHFHAPLAWPEPRETTRRLFGRPLQPLPRFDRAEVVLSLDADFLGAGPFHLHHARRFAEARRLRSRDGRMSRLYSVAVGPTRTHETADHALARTAHGLRALATAVAAELAARTPGTPEGLAGAVAAPRPTAADARWARAVARDLDAHRGRALVVAGDAQPLVVQVLAHVMNELLGAGDRTLDFVPPALRHADAEEETLAALVEAMRAGEVRRLVVLGGNPVYDAPADLGFAGALDAVDEVVALSMRADETALRADWRVPRLSYLERWGDARAADGTASLVQPLIAPLYGGEDRAGILAALAGDGTRTPHERLRESWTSLDEGAWRDALRRGVIEGSGAAGVPARLDWDRALETLAAAPADPTPADGVELAFRPDTSVYDGRFANNPWLQELPDPVTRLTWDNAAWIPPGLARRHGVGDGDWVELRRGGRRVVLPVLVVPSVAEGAVVVQLGYGRRGGLSVAQDVGFDVYPLWNGEPRAAAALAPGGAAGRPSPWPLARTQTHFALHHREDRVLHHLDLAAYRTPPAEPAHEPEAALYTSPASDEGPQWGMAVDLSACIGCAACVVACQAENVIPVVGKEGVRNGREMHWIRIDRYEIGSREEPRAAVQPMLCQHCEMAPCEYVCPVNATVHSDDGLNEMIYNRCIGTRFCSNNCPYKVRRFNWLEYNGRVPPERRMQHNPDVTVRARGVMEKCTYCVQRIRRAQIDARREDRPLADGEVQTACQQTCPTRAIRFGDVGDPDTDVSGTLRAPQTFSVLEELGTRPRTRYLARIRNPNPELAGTGEGPESGGAR